MAIKKTSKTDEPALIEYRLRPVTRWMVTRYEQSVSNVRAATPHMKAAGKSTQHGSFDDPTTAYQVAYALCTQDHNRLGWPIDDDRIQYPREVPGVDADETRKSRQM